MKFRNWAWMALLATLWSCAEPTVKEYNKGIRITPYPKTLTQQEGEFTLSDKTLFVLSNGQPELNRVVDYFAAKIKASTGYALMRSESKNDHSIILSIDATLPVNEEGYRLKVTTSGVEIVGKSAQGLFYGMQTLMQLLPAEIESPKRVRGIAWTIPCVQIEDEPRFGYRGVMLDVCRHFYDKEFVKKQLDVLAMYKMNRFHWHLTEDQLWAIEIKKYPELAKKASQRINSNGSVTSGYFTQEDVKEVLAYAAERFITVIPEVELPGHARAALSVYPELSCTGGPFEVRNVWGVEDDVYCAGNDKTFEFIENVIKEVAELFPGKYLHIGGDECPKVRWEKCPKCQARMKQEKLKNTHELQSYFVKRAERIAEKYGKSIIGWDEILEGGLAPSATVMSWRGEEGGIEAAKMGHDVIMTPYQSMYLDYAQGGIEVEPLSISYSFPLKKFYAYEPASDKIPDELKKHVLGAQGNMWTEYAPTAEIVEYMLYPRVLAVAELTWTPKELKDYESFAYRLGNQEVRLALHGVEFHIPMPEGPKADRIALIDTVTLSFENSRSLPMVYTLDGSIPTAKSTLYEKPLVFDRSTSLKIATLTEGGRLSRVRELSIIKEEPWKAVEVASIPGLRLMRAEGKFSKLADLKGAQWKELSVEPIFKQPSDYSQYASDARGAYRYEGYIEVPQDGVYFIVTEMDQVEVDGKEILNNDGKITRHFFSRTSIPLKKGKHSLRVTCVNANMMGYLRAWNNQGIQIGRHNETLQFPTQEMLSH